MFLKILATKQIGPQLFNTCINDRLFFIEKAIKPFVNLGMITLFTAAVTTNKGSYLILSMTQHPELHENKSEKCIILRHK